MRPDCKLDRGRGVERGNGSEIELGLLLPAPAVPLLPASSPSPSHTAFSVRRLDKLARILDMKFSHSIQFNAVPEWSNNYISYSNLKKLSVARVQTLPSRPSPSY